jgi:hypothetical protein
MRPSRSPVIILQLQHIEGRRRPPKRQVRPFHLRRLRIQHGRQVSEQQALRVRRHSLHRPAQRRRRLRQHRPRRIQRRQLRRVVRPPHVSDRHRRKPRHRRLVIQADAVVRRHPPPRLANLEPHPHPGRDRNPGKGLRPPACRYPSPPHAPATARGRRRLPPVSAGARPPRCFHPSGMHVQQLVRSDQITRPQRLRPAPQIPCHARTARSAPARLHLPSPRTEIVAHPT